MVMASFTKLRDITSNFDSQSEALLALLAGDNTVMCVEVSEGSQCRYHTRFWFLNITLFLRKHF